MGSISASGAEETQTGTIPDTADASGNKLSYSYDEGTKTLTISGTGELENRLHDEAKKRKQGLSELLRLLASSCYLLGKSR